MNAEEFIASGILESYILGELSAEERREVERYMDEYPEVRREVQELERTQQIFLENIAVSPPSKVRENIMSQLSDRPAKSPAILPARRNSWRWIAAASLFIAVVAGGLAFKYYKNWQEAQGQLSELIARNQEIAENYNHVQHELEQIRADLNVVDNPDFSRVQLAREGGNPEAVVYWNKSNQEVYLKILALDALAQDQQYQLWALIDGQPVDAGVFDGNREGILRMKNIAEADAFAVTIEPRGGSVSPTLSALQISGETL